MVLVMKKSRRIEERGVSALELTLMLPTLLILLLMFLQVGLIVQAAFVVDHAAYAAIRSAIVTIPTTMRLEDTTKTEQRNEVRLQDPDSPKLIEIRRTAALVLTAISPRSRVDGMAISSRSPSGMVAMGRVLGLFSAVTGHPELAAQTLERVPYAYDALNTRIELVPMNDRQRDGRFFDHDEITVRVTYRYALVVPGAARIIGQRHPDGGYYFEITDQYTLPIEGEPIFPPSNIQTVKSPVITVRKG